MEEKGKPTHPGGQLAADVPDQFREIFLKAQEYVEKLFSSEQRDPFSATIKIGDDRYILMRAASMSTDFVDALSSMYADLDKAEAVDAANRLLYEIAHTIGKADARHFHEKMGLSDPVEKLSAGPVHFAFTGWAFVKILPESRPSPDENFFLIYDHPYSFEAEAWLRAGRANDTPVCLMSAGYSAGWCEESFGIRLESVEIECRVSGDAHCRFIMAPPERLPEYVERYGSRHYSSTSLKKALPRFMQRKRLEEELVRQRDLAQLYLDLVDVMIVTLDRNGMVTMVNRKACEVLECEHKRILGMDWFENAIPEEIRDQVKDVFLRLMRGGRSADAVEYHENQVKTKSGRRRLIAWHNTVLKDERGNPAGTLSAGLDITEQRAMERALQDSERLFRSVSEAARDAIIMTDDEDKVVLWNPAAEKIFGYTRQEMLGRKLHDTLVPEHYREAFRKAHPRFRETGEGDAVGKTLQLQAVKKDGSEIDIELSLASLRLNGKWHAVAVMRDISERKRHERELEESRDYIVNFTSQATHDLKKPLAAIKTGVTMLEAGKLGELTPQQQQAVSLASEAAKYMETLIQELLNIARMDAGRLEINRRKTDMNEVAGKVVSLLRPLAEEKNAEITVKPLPEANVDPDHVGKIFMNLVGNSLSYLSPDRPGKVEIGAVENSSPPIFYVKDNGIGITAEDQEKIFERFARSERTAKIRGTGLGLAIVKGLVEAHGGEIWLESKVDEGTTFFFTLEPAEQPDPEN